MRLRFASLDPYDPTKLHGSILKLEDENFDQVTGEQRELWCYAVSEKSYALFNHFASGYEACCAEPRPACPLFDDP